MKKKKKESNNKNEEEEYLQIGNVIVPVLPPSLSHPHPPFVLLRLAAVIYCEKNHHYFLFFFFFLFSFSHSFLPSFLAEYKIRNAKGEKDKNRREG
eukprot:TRINITY_DN5913_c1_g2_i1.p1 TRINITY_DN5913_c1_g2~~TRINITY_DN5913_c1_g2_i1.p1  ORF type:complete len:105 (+),score=8.15 TRINITY_DN5913_c1_g2_i1:30-317(+)